MSKKPRDEQAQALAERLVAARGKLGAQLWESVVGRHTVRLLRRQDTVSIDDLLTSLRRDLEAGTPLIRAEVEPAITRLEEMRAGRPRP